MSLKFGQKLDPLRYIHNFLNTFGINLINQQLGQCRLSNSKLLLALLVLDLIVMKVAFIISWYRPSWSFYLGDLSAIVFGHGNLMFLINIFFRCEALALLINYHFDSHRWLVKANQDFDHLEALQIDSRLNTFSRRLIWAHWMMMFGCFTFFMLLLVGQLNWCDSFSWWYLPGVAYQILSICFTFHAKIMFYLEYALIINMNQVFCEELDRQLCLKELPPVIVKYLEQYLSYFIFSHRFSEYLRRSYLIIVGFTVIISLPIYFYIQITDISPIAKVTFIITFAWFLSIIFVIIDATGKIDNQARLMSERVYEWFCFDRPLPLLTLKEQMTLLHYFECAGKGTLGFEVLSNPINLRTIITVINIIAKQVHKYCGF